MSDPIPLEDFTLYFILYAIISLLVYLGTAFTGLAFLIYLLTLAPFYCLCCIVLICFNLHRSRSSRKLIRYRVLLLVPIIIFQCLVILTSPASCYGWSQGSACYSFIQAHSEHLFGKISSVPHWQIESLFPWVLLIYITSILIFLVMIRIENRQDNEDQSNS
jgi:hypothetical protein